MICLSGKSFLIAKSKQNNLSCCQDLVVLRSRPIIDITTFVDDGDLVGIDPGTRGCPEDPNSDETCFSFRACFRVVQEEDVRRGSGGGLDISFVIEAEPMKPLSRVWLRLTDLEAGGNVNKSSLVTGRISINRGDLDYCTAIIGYVSSSISDLQVKASCLIYLIYSFAKKI